MTTFKDSGNRTVSASVYKKPFSVTGPATGWVAETTTRDETNSPTLAELTFPTMEIYAMPSATQSLLDDSAVNIDEWLAEEIQVAFAGQEGESDAGVALGGLIRNRVSVGIGNVVVRSAEDRVDGKMNDAGFRGLGRGVERGLGKLLPGVCRFVQD